MFRVLCKMSAPNEADFLLYVMKSLAIIAISIVGFILTFRTKSKKKQTDFYTNPGTTAKLYQRWPGVMEIRRVHLWPIKSESVSH